MAAWMKVADKCNGRSFPLQTLLLHVKYKVGRFVAKRKIQAVDLSSCDFERVDVDVGEIVIFT